MELPLGFAMALAQNEPAMTRFSAMPDAEKSAVVQQAQLVRSKDEMRRLVDGLSSRGS